MGNYGQPAVSRVPNAAGNLLSQSGWAPFHVGTGQPMFTFKAMSGQLVLQSADEKSTHWTYLLAERGSRACLWVKSAQLELAVPGTERPGHGRQVRCTVVDKPHATGGRDVFLSYRDLIEAAMARRELIEVGNG